MVFFGWATFLNRSPTFRIAILALTISSGIEALKLNQTPWLLSARHTPLGHLVFGQAFSWRNLVAYVAGILAGVVCDRLLLFRFTG